MGGISLMFLALDEWQPKDQAGGLIHFPVDIQFSYCYNNPIDYHTAGKSHPYTGLLNADGIEECFAK